MPSEIHTGISGWVKHLEVIKNKIEYFVAITSKYFNMSPELSQRFKESVFPLATQAVFTFLITKDTETGDAIAKKIDAFMPDFLPIFSNVFNKNTTTNKIGKTILNHTPHIIKQAFQNELNKKNTSLLETSLKCLINENKSLTCQQIYLNILLNIYEFYISSFKEDDSEITKILLNTGKYIKQRISTKISKNVDFWNAIKESAEASLPELEIAATNKKLSN